MPTWNRRRVLLLLASAWLAACGASAPAWTPAPPQTLALADHPVIVVKMNTGRLNIVGGESGLLTMSGSAAAFAPPASLIPQPASKIYIDVPARGAAFLAPNAPPQLDLRVSAGSVITVETFDAEINVRAYTGTLSVASTAGNTTLQDVNGQVAVYADRGAVTLQAGAGRISVAGNYGLLTLENAGGDVSVSTIMGTIRFSGGGSAGDAFHLETDHGPIEIRLAPGTNLTTRVKSTSGEVDCVVPGLAPAGRGCAGTLGTGAGTLDVRTVSGAVNLQQKP